MHSREQELLVRRCKNKNHVVGNIPEARLKQSLDDVHNQMLWLERQDKIKLIGNFNAIPRS